VWEWMETAYDGGNNIAGERRELRGGAWYYSLSLSLGASYRLDNNPEVMNETVGFRVAMVPEPSSLSLLVLGGVVVALRRRQKRA